jgi:signal transduction histidine kinase
LGLALVLRVAQLHEGSVEIVPGIDGGAGIAMHLPLRIAQAPVTPKSAAASLPR